MTIYRSDFVYCSKSRAETIRRFCPIFFYIKKKVQDAKLFYKFERLSLSYAAKHLSVSYYYKSFNFILLSICLHRKNDMHGSEMFLCLAYDILRSLNVQRFINMIKFLMND